MSDWATISSLATAGGTLVLAVATFASVRAGQRAARVAERSFLIGMRPVPFPSRREDPVEKARFGDGTMLKVPGGTAAVERGDGGELYFAIALRNVGSGLAVIHGWRVMAGRQGPARPDLDGFRLQGLDLYRRSRHRLLGGGPARARGARDGRARRRRRCDLPGRRADVRPPLRRLRRGPAHGDPVLVPAARQRPGMVRGRHPHSPLDGAVPRPTEDPHETAGSGLTRPSPHGPSLHRRTGPAESDR